MQSLLLVKWLIILCAAGLYIYRLMQQDDRLARGALQHPPISQQTLLKCVQSRFLQIICLLACCLVLLAVDEVSSLHARGTGLQTLPAKTAVTAPPPVPKLPPSPAVNELDAALTNANAQEALEDRLDAMKESYEGGFVSYFFLRRCEVAKPEDIFPIRKALLRDLIRVSQNEALAASMAESIESAAKGSYTELYATSPCEAGVLKNMRDQYQRYLGNLAPAAAAAGAAR